MERYHQDVVPRDVHGWETWAIEEHRCVDDRTLPQTWSGRLLPAPGQTKPMQRMDQKNKEVDDSDRPRSSNAVEDRVVAVEEEDHGNDEARWSTGIEAAARSWVVREAVVQHWDRAAADDEKDVETAPTDCANYQTHCTALDD